MKKLPASWSRSKDPQLSFADALFGKPTPEDLFIADFLLTMQNLKFLRYRVNYSKAKKIEILSAYESISNALEAGAILMSKVAKKSQKYYHKTDVEFLNDVFVERITWPTAESATMSELRSHHDNVSAKITGMFLAYSSILKKHKREVNKITQGLKSSHITLHRLNVI